MIDRRRLALPGLAFLLTAAAACSSASAAERGIHLPPAEQAAMLAPAAGRDSVIFAGGCFWGVEAVFERVKGVLDVTSGYAGGTSRDPSYEMVSTGTTGYAESVKIIFDPAVVSYSQLLQVFFAVAHDPTEKNRQGPDVGTQYRSAIFYASPAQKQLTEGYIDQLTKAHTFAAPIVTEVRPWGSWHQAEAYHQGYYDAHPYSPYIIYNDKPKVAALKKEFPSLYMEKM